MYAYEPEPISDRGSHCRPSLHMHYMVSPHVILHLPAEGAAWEIYNQMTAGVGVGGDGPAAIRFITPTLMAARVVGTQLF